jgi:hypothetical protein
MIKSLIKKEYEFRNDLMERILNKKEYSSIDCKNAETLMTIPTYLIINESIKNFCNSKTFIEEYNSLKNIFEEVIEKGKFIENKYYSNAVQKLNLKLIPLNDDYFIHFDNNEKYLSVIKETSKPNSPKFEYKILFRRKDQSINDKIIIKNFDSNTKDLTFFFVSIFDHKKELYEMKINNLSDYQDKAIINQINVNNKFENFIILSEQNYIISDFYNIYLYDNLFKKNKIIESIMLGRIIDLFKINENSFVYSNNYDTNSYFMTNIDNDLIGKIPINKCGEYFIKYFEKEKLLTSRDSYFIYLINFNIPFPEVIQKLEIINLPNLESSHKLSSFAHIDKNYQIFKGNESFFIIKKEKSFENRIISYVIQYKLIGKELNEISRVEISNYYYNYIIGN